MRWRGHGTDWHGVLSMIGAQVWTFVLSWPNSVLLCLFLFSFNLPSNFFLCLSFDSLLYRSVVHMLMATVPSFPDAYVLSRVSVQRQMCTVHGARFEVRTNLQAISLRFAPRKFDLFHANVPSLWGVSLLTALTLPLIDLAFLLLNPARFEPASETLWFSH